MRKIICWILVILTALQMLACGTYTVTVPEDYMDYIPEDVKDVAGSILENAQEKEAAKSCKFGPVDVKKDESFNGIWILVKYEQFKQAGFTEGDSVDITFSNGYRLLDIPFFSGYYGKKGDPVLVAYPGQEFINCNLINSTIWDQSGLKEGDRAVIELNTKEKYLVKENTFHLSVPMEKGPETSDEVFANFRALTCTTLKENYIYRSASPCDNTYNRVETVDALLEKAGIRYVVDLADTKEELDERLNSGKVSDYYRNIILSGNYFTQRLGTPGSEDYSRGMAEAARAILSTEGPFLVHCLEGKDRTGFLCVLLEAVSGASYEEIQKDYMMTYQNYFNITKEQTQEKYDAILENYFLPITEMVRDADSAREYLLNAGMLPEEIDALIEKISK